MDFSGLVRAVQDFWNFICPPVICIVVLYGLSAYVAPYALKAGWSRLAGLRPAPETQVAAFKSVKRFGFDKLIPFLVAFCLLFLFDGVRSAVVGCGHLIPPNISYKPEKLLLTHADSYEVRTLWYRAGSPNDISEFLGKIDRVVSEAREAHKNSPALNSVRYWEDKGNDAYVVFDACKFFLLWSVMIAVVEMRTSAPVGRTVFRLCCAVILLGGVAIVYSLRFAWAVDQTFSAKNSAALIFMPSATPVCDPAVDGCKNYYQFIDASRRIRSSPGRWLIISGADFYYLRWLERQVINELE